jgi:transposase-like protein
LFPRIPRQRRECRRHREPGQTIKQIAADFDISESCVRNANRQSGVEDVVAGRMANTCSIRPDAAQNRY